MTSPLPVDPTPVINVFPPVGTPAWVNGLFVVAGAIAGGGFTYLSNRRSDEQRTLADKTKQQREDDQRWDTQLRDLTAKFIGISWTRTSGRRKIRRSRSAIISTLSLPDQISFTGPRVSWSDPERVKFTPLMAQYDELEASSSDIDMASNMAYADLLIVAPKIVRDAAQDVREKAQTAAKAISVERQAAADDEFKKSREHLEQVVRDALRVK